MIIDSSPASHCEWSARKTGTTRSPFKCHHPTTLPGGLTGRIFAVGAPWDELQHFGDPTMQNLANQYR